MNSSLLILSLMPNHLNIFPLTHSTISDFTPLAQVLLHLSYTFSLLSPFHLVTKEQFQIKLISHTVFLSYIHLQKHHNRQMNREWTTDSIFTQVLKSQSQYSHTHLQQQLIFVLGTCHIKATFFPCTSLCMQDPPQQCTKKFLQNYQPCCTNQVSNIPASRDHL